MLCLPLWDLFLLVGLVGLVELVLLCGLHFFFDEFGDVGGVEGEAAAADFVVEFGEDVSCLEEFVGSAVDDEACVVACEDSLLEFVVLESACCGDSIEEVFGALFGAVADEDEACASVVRVFHLEVVLVFWGDEGEFEEVEVCVFISRLFVEFA